MNTLWNTQLHWLTLVFIVLETVFLLFYELPRYLEHPKDPHRGWFMVLLVLLIHYNIWNGLLPDIKHFSIDIRIQYILLDGIAYLMGAYFPFYFYKAFGLDNLRFYATYGVTLFLLLPYGLFVWAYFFNGRLLFDRLICLTVPTLYGLVVLTVMYKAIYRKYKRTQNKRQYLLEKGAFIAIMPWEVMSAFVFKLPPQELKIIMANIGFVTLAFLQVVVTVTHSRREHKPPKKLINNNPTPHDFLENCAFYHFSKTETEVAGYVRKGLSNKKIAALIFRSEETVKSHIKSMLKKTGAESRAALTYLLEYGRPDSHV